MVAHEMTVPVYYEDTDMAGVVYYANYLRYFERARTELFKSVGVDPAEWVAKGVTFAVTHAEADYKSNVGYGSTLVLRTTVEPLRGARLIFRYQVTNQADGRLLVKGRTDMACLNERMRPRRVPDEIMNNIVEESATP
jgi:acyl-CoA thioester hydrolase